MKNFKITYRIGPQVQEKRELLVESTSAELAVEKAGQVLALRYPHHRIVNVAPGMDFASDAREIYAPVQRLRAER